MGFVQIENEGVGSREIVLKFCKICRDFKY